MESNKQSIHRQGGEFRHTEGSNVFSKSVHSRLYESFQLQNSGSLIQGHSYDATYQNGFPKLYSFDTSVQGKSRISLDAKNKYSFRND